MSAFAMKASKAGGGGEKAPPGNHLAILIGIFDMGTQPHEYQGKETWRRDVYLLWELCGEKIAGTNKNHVIGTALTFSLNEKATLRHWVQARTGKVIADGAEFDLSTELAQPCLLNVVEKNGYPRIEGMAALPKGLPVPAPTYAPTILTIEEFQAGVAIPEWVPWHYGNPLEDHIKASKEIGGHRPVRKAQPDPTAEQCKGPIPF